MSKVVERALASNEYLRNRRMVVFRAFDIYKENVNYGIVEETQEKHEEILNWYRACCDLDKNAINNVPSEVAKYLW